MEKITIMEKGTSRTDTNTMNSAGATAATKLGAAQQRGKLAPVARA